MLCYSTVLLHMKVVRNHNLLLFLYCWIIICISNNIVIIKSVIKLFVFRIIFLRPVPRSICCCCCSVTELCLTLYHPMDCSMPGSSVCGILQARILEWIVISLSRGSSRTRDWTHISCIGRQFLYHQALREVIYMCVCVRVLSSFSHVRLFVTPWTEAHQAPLSVEFSRQEYGSGLPFSSPGDLPNPGTEPLSPELAGRFFTTVPPGKPL